MNKKIDKTKPEELVSLIVRKVPLSLRQALRAKTAIEGVSMQDKMIELIKKYVEDK